MEAGCLPSDIKSALKNHVKGSDIKPPAVLEEKEVCTLPCRASLLTRCLCESWESGCTSGMVDLHGELCFLP